MYICVCFYRQKAFTYSSSSKTAFHYVFFLLSWWNQTLPFVIIVLWIMIYNSNLAKNKPVEVSLILLWCRSKSFKISIAVSGSKFPNKPYELLSLRRFLKLSAYALTTFLASFGSINMLPSNSDLKNEKYYQVKTINKSKWIRMKEIQYL